MCQIGLGIAKALARVGYFYGKLDQYTQQNVASVLFQLPGRISYPRRSLCDLKTLFSVQKSLLFGSPRAGTSPESSSLPLPHLPRGPTHQWGPCEWRGRPEASRSHSPQTRHALFSMSIASYLYEDTRLEGACRRGFALELVVQLPAISISTPCMPSRLLSSRDCPRHLRPSARASVLPERKG